MADPELVRILKEEGVEAWNRFTRGHGRIWRAFLRDADLEGADLRNANLLRAYLRASNLKGANLGRAYLRRAYLREVDLTDADLSGANLRNANLTAAKLCRANLTGANLAEANLCDASFGGAVLWGTFFARMDLSSSNGLAEARHWGPSTVDNHSLSFSKGKVPDRFLRGCGFQDWEIATARLYDPDLTEAERMDLVYEIARLHTAAPLQRNPIFLSYTHADGPFVDRLQAALDKKDVRSWRDVHHATAGPIQKVIDRAITQNPTMVLVLSENSVCSPWVRWEIEKAVKLERKDKRPVLCPIALDDSWKTELPVPERKEVERYTVLDYSADDAIKKMMPRLLEGLDIHYRGEARGE